MKVSRVTADRPGNSVDCLSESPPAFTESSYKKRKENKKLKKRNTEVSLVERKWNGSSIFIASLYAQAAWVATEKVERKLQLTEIIMRR